MDAHYNVSLIVGKQVDKSDWNETELYGYLRTRIGENEADEAIAEAQAKGSATRSIPHVLGGTTRIVFSPGA